MAEPVTEADLREKLLAVDRTSEEKILGAHGHRPELEQWAQQHGFEIVDWVFENGVSGAKPVLLRRQLVAALWQVEDDPEFAGVIFPSTAREAREGNAFEAIRYAMMTIAKHCYVAIQDKQGALLEMRDVAAEETIEQRHSRQIDELEAIKARTALSLEGVRARRAKIARGGYGGGRLQPAWFMDRVELGDGRAEFTPDSSRLQWALWVRERHQEGWSGPRIAAELNRLEVFTRAGNPWTRTSVHKLRASLDRIPADILAVWTGSAGPSLRDGHEMARSA